MRQWGFGNTPSSVGASAGDRTVRLTKSGFASWERKLKTSTGAVNIAPGPTSPASYQLNFERARKQIGEKLAKQKLQLVKDAADADIVLVVTEYTVTAGATASGYSYCGTATAVANSLVCIADEIKALGSSAGCRLSEGGPLPRLSPNCFGTGREHKLNLL